VVTDRCEGHCVVWLLGLYTLLVDFRGGCCTSRFFLNGLVETGG
jgi:hypothetical protein